MGKARRCRVCKKSYLVPSQWPGSCSKECSSERKPLLKSQRLAALLSKEKINSFKTISRVEWRDQIKRKYGR